MLGYNRICLQNIIRSLSFSVFLKLSVWQLKNAFLHVNIQEPFLCYIIVLAVLYCKVSSLYALESKFFFYLFAIFLNCVSLLILLCLQVWRDPVVFVVGESVPEFQCGADVPVARDRVGGVHTQELCCARARLTPGWGTVLLAGHVRWRAPLLHLLSVGVQGGEAHRPWARWGMREWPVAGTSRVHVGMSGYHWFCLWVPGFPFAAGPQGWDWRLKVGVPVPGEDKAGPRPGTSPDVRTETWWQ